MLESLKVGFDSDPERFLAKRWTMLAAVMACALGAAWILLIRPVGASETDFKSFQNDLRAAASPDDGSVYSELVSYVGEIAGAKPIQIAALQPQSPHAAAQAPQHDDYFALVEYVQRLDGGDLNEARIELAAAEPGKPAKPAKPRAVKRPVSAATALGGADYVGDKTCLGCHAAHAATFSQTVMGKIAKNPRHQGELSCESCHGPGSAHVAAGGGRGAGGIISFRKDDPAHTVEENNGVCLTCHERGDRTLWRGSTHENRAVGCTDCHTVMRNVTPKHQLSRSTEVDTCAQCHKNKRAEIWRTSHMPIREGKMTCSSCHNPHGSYTESLLKEATVNDTCYQCHAEKRGPFLWEHPPVRENCLNCHDPHGSNNDYLLKVSRPRLCQQCHSGGQHPSNPRNPASVYALGRECQNCHMQHHGSNSPAGVRFQR
jgi:DmsE family decaheme c-type cytochrome